MNDSSRRHLFTGMTLKRWLALGLIIAFIVLLNAGRISSLFGHEKVTVSVNSVRLSQKPTTICIVPTLQGCADRRVANQTICIVVTRTEVFTADANICSRFKSGQTYSVGVSGIATLITTRHIKQIY
jgi:hypothetical protein